MSDPSPVILDAATVQSLLPKVDTLAVLRSLFLELAEGTAVQPPQSLSLFPEGKGDFISYLGTLARKGVFGVKLSPYIVTSDRPIITAWTTLMSASTGQPLALCDAGLPQAICDAATNPPGPGGASPIQPLCDAGLPQAICDAAAGGGSTPPDPGTILQPICDLGLPLPICDLVGGLPLRHRVV